MVVVFVVCWIPLNALGIYLDIMADEPDFSPPSVMIITCHIIAMTSAVYNPLLYAWLSETFRRNLRTMLPRWNRKSMETVGATMTPGPTPALLGEALSPTTTFGREANEISRRSLDLQTCT